MVFVIILELDCGVVLPLFSSFIPTVSDNEVECCMQEDDIEDVEHVDPEKGRVIKQTKLIAKYAQTQANICHCKNVHFQ